MSVSSTETVDARALRAAIYGKGSATRPNLAGLIALGPRAGADEDFIALVAEVAKDLFVDQADPPGYVSEADADWLTARLGEGAGLSCRAEYEVLKTVIGHAVSVPVTLTSFAVREVERAILTGRRDAHSGLDQEPGKVTREDVEALRQISFSPTQGSSMHVTRATAEALFDIAHATATADNAPEFADFFARAVANYLMGVAFTGTPDRAEASRHQRELDQPASFGGFLSALSGGVFSDGDKAALETIEEIEEDNYYQQNVEAEARMEAASRIDVGEAKWVLAHLTRGELSEAEKRLIGFLRDEATSVTPELQALFDRAA